MSTYFVTDAATRALIQEQLLERLFKDSMFYELLFRKEFTGDEWKDRAQSGVRTRAGLILPNTTPLAPKTDPTPKSYDVEQWEVFVNHYGDSVDTDTVVSGLALDELLTRDGKTLGIQAGQSVNRLARAGAYNAASWGHGLTTTVGNGTTKALPYLNGFTRAYSATTRKFEAVSGTNPLRVYWWTGAAFTARNVVGYTPTTAGDEAGPGTIELSVALVTTARQPVIASTATYLVRQGGGYSPDDLVAGDKFRLATLRALVARFRQENVKPLADGTYHVHLDPMQEAGLWEDGEFQLVTRGRGFKSDENDPYASFHIETVLGCKLYRNNDCPLTTNVQTYGTNGEGYAGELLNAAGVPIRRAIAFGQESAIEYWKSVIGVTEAGITGKVGNWSVTNDGMKVDIDRVQMILRSPIDRMQRVVSTSWSFFGSHVIAQDYLFPGKAVDAVSSFDTGSSRYKRVAILETA